MSGDTLEQGRPSLPAVPGASNVATAAGFVLVPTLIADAG